MLRLFSVEKLIKSIRPEALECCTVSWFYWPQAQVGFGFLVAMSSGKWQVAGGSSKRLWLLQVPVLGTSTRIFVVPVKQMKRIQQVLHSPLQPLLCAMF